MPSNYSTLKTTYKSYNDSKLGENDFKLSGV